MNLRLKRTPGLYIVGFMACGKSTVGRLLAERLGWSFVDLDYEIETAEQCAIAKIFEGRGEAEFRRIESEALRARVWSIEQGRPAVLSLGGGAFVDPANRACMMQNGITIWLDCPFDIIQRRVGTASHRPLARDPEKFSALYESRLEIYALADARVKICGDDPAPAVDAILSHPILR